MSFSIISGMNSPWHTFRGYFLKLANFLNFQSVSIFILSFMREKVHSVYLGGSWIIN